MPVTGTSETRLIILRGNSGSGKSTVAQGIRERHGRGIAIVGQDYLRRTVLHERDVPGGVNIGLIDLAARYALDHGCHVILEGILREDHYAQMLCRLAHDHRGVTRAFYFDVSFDETLRRHETKAESAAFGEAEMRGWYRPRDLVAGLDEQHIPETMSLDESVSLIVHEAALSTGDVTCLDDGGTPLPAAHLATVGVGCAGKDVPYP